MGVVFRRGYSGRVMMMMMAVTGGAGESFTAWRGLITGRARPVTRQQTSFVTANWQQGSRSARDGGGGDARSSDDDRSSSDGCGNGSRDRRRRWRRVIAGLLIVWPSTAAAAAPAAPSPLVVTRRSLVTDVARTKQNKIQTIEIKVAAAGKQANSTAALHGSQNGGHTLSV
jgi:hypothetical protein